jgi:hypothetical protein
MLGRRRRERVGRFSDGQATIELNLGAERSGSFGDGQRTTDRATQEHGRFSTGQEQLSTDPEHDRIGRFSDGLERRADTDSIQPRNDHGLPEMGFRAAFTRRKEITSRASHQGLIEAANRAVFHRRGYTLTWDTDTGDLWLTPTADPNGWSYEEDAV